MLSLFIHALRNADVRISTAETLDAFKTAQLVGYGDRELLKTSLAMVLAKTQEEKAVFDACFERFFASRDGSSLHPPGDSLSDAPDMSPAPDGNSSREKGGSAGEKNQADSNPAYGSAASVRRMRSDEHSQQEVPDATVAESAAHPRSALGQLLIRGNATEISAAISAAGSRVNIHAIEVFTQKGVYTRKILQALGIEALQQDIATLRASSSVQHQLLANNLSQRREWLRERVREYVEQQFLLHADVSGRRLREDLLRTVRLSALDHRHQRQLQEIVLRMAKRLMASHARRKQVLRRGALHVSRTLRRNMKYDEAIFELRYKSVRESRPKVFAICDVSGSVAQYSGFMLMLLYSLEAVLPKLRAFAFSASLGEVSELFARETLENAVTIALRQHGGGATDYGQALVDFKSLCLEHIDRRTTVIILGDARNNMGDARTDILQEIYERSRRVLWLNPEAHSLWNTGDSEMKHFAAYCHQVDECGTLQQLERIVSKLMRN